MEREKLEEIVNNRLNEFGMLKLESYKDNIREYLIKIEEYIQTISARRTEIYEEYKSLKVNIKAISKNTKIARQTLYNNREYLEKYIQLRQDEFEKSDLFINLNRDKETIMELKETIEKLYDRDLKEQLRLDEVEELEREKESLIKEIKILSKNNELLHKEIESMKKKLKGISNISNINDSRSKNND